ncbi:hypothetical protein BDV96DRAFT_649524 [Lophiotrema nucula]|uniref:Tat pathway signal sequence n=1 Tax=Lophiotrema nucula TaxID=690887 RepID=A0A6A5YZC0_9PLEO|nr:hypothetical protein BDV96DRAFT_649524 [Lophiotrema nucula]
MDFWDRQLAHNERKGHQQIPEPQPKRISTPAGQRLSVILENGDVQAKTRDPRRASIRKSVLSAAVIGAAPRESLEDSNDGSGYSYSVWSDNEKFNALRHNKTIAKRGGWKRLAVIIAIVLACIIALAVGLALGLKKKKSSNSSSEQPAAAASTQTTSPNNINNSPNPTATTALSPSSTPSNFPAGTYSLVTFLDTVQTNCTSNPSTWTCYPYTIYNTDHATSLATFNWIITSSSSGNYQISSTTNPFSISFNHTDLELLDEGKDTERYWFQMTATKTVSPSSSLTDDNAAAECEFEGTSLQASLYTKMAKGYPEFSTDANPSYTTWPFAVRVEQTVGGGPSIPSCYKVNSDGGQGDAIDDGFKAQDAGNLCSCLYRNYITPNPN